MSRKRFSIDFDGVLHSYTSGWVKGRGDEVLDPPNPGALAALCAYVERFDVYICSTRCARPTAIENVRRWLLAHGLPEEVLSKLIFTCHKVPGVLHLDDRAMKFRGVFPSCEQVDAFQPYYREEARVERPAETLEFIRRRIAEDNAFGYTSLSHDQLVELQRYIASLEKQVF